MNETKMAEQSFSDMCALVTELAGHTVQHPMDGVTVYDGGFTSFNWYSRICVESPAADHPEQAEKLLSLLEASRLPLLSFTVEDIPESFASRLPELGYKPEVTQTGMIVPLPLVSNTDASVSLNTDATVRKTPASPDAGTESNARSDSCIIRIGAEELDAWSDTVCRAFQKPDDKNAFQLMIHCDDCHFFAWEENGEILGTTLLYTKNGNAGIHEVGVLHKHRRRGIAAALVRHALKVAADEGAAISTLQASDLGLPVYESLGYKKVSRIRTWINPPRIPALAAKEAD